MHNLALCAKYIRNSTRLSSLGLSIFHETTAFPSIRASEQSPRLILPSFRWQSHRAGRFHHHIWCGFGNDHRILPRWIRLFSFSTLWSLRYSWFTAFKQLFFSVRGAKTLFSCPTSLFFFARRCLSVFYAIYKRGLAAIWREISAYIWQKAKFVLFFAFAAVNVQ